ncbi:hypothetical protein [Burkholderia cenocepacia]|uniref:hypothetical protein n=1 Tax=Burkholderia cenocepacia TaxID=95486 RepID=UPI0006AC979A|nr:hypothetical protein [Burkholderia cenocepacia]KOR18931.1 hypothetical protein ABW54_24420 [Burkholderia cenocepacia]
MSGHASGTGTRDENFTSRNARLDWIDCIDCIDDMPACFLGTRSMHPAKGLAAMPVTVYRGALGETRFTPHGNLKHGAISVFTYKGGRKALLDIVRM